MRLQVGERLSGSGPAQQPGGYVVTEVLSETPWQGLYGGKKILYNFDFSSKRVRESDEKEWLDVILRTIRYPTLDDPDYVTQRRSLARSEVRFVLGLGSSNLLPEPIDLLELVNTRDPFTFPQSAADLEPIVVNARPHGHLLSDWQQKPRPIASILAVLAELLAFIDKSHQDGFILNGMGPASILVDHADRIHFVGTEMMTVFSRDATYSERSALRSEYVASRLNFPPERYPRGFSPPECFSAAGPDPRSDLYAFGSLAFFLLTGQKPWQIALDQGRPWVHFQENQFAALEKVLRDVPKTHVANFLEQIGLGEHVKSLAWPQSVVGVMRRLLHPDARRRPASVAELRRWIVSPPPPMVAGILAWRISPDEARVLLDATGLDPQLQIAVRRGVEQAPSRPVDGLAIFEGPWPPSTSNKAETNVVHDRQAPGPDQTVYYSAFTWRHDGKESAVSQAASAELIEPTPVNILRLAQAESAHLSLKDDAPAVVRLFFKALEPTVVANALFDSSQPVVRSWALRQLHKLRKTQIPDPALDALLWRGVGDPVGSLRRESAREILARIEPTEKLLERLAWTMGHDNVDEAIQATGILRSLGVPGDMLQRVVDRLSEATSQTCPVCQEKISGRQRPEHLRNAHGYVEVDGSLLPRPEALARLWDKVLQEGSESAHEQLLMFSRDATYSERSALRSEYVTSLEVALQDSPREKLIQCLRQSQHVLPLLPQLLRSRDPRLHEIAREVLLPRLGEMLHSGAVSPQDLRRALDGVCPGADLLEEKILLCYRLPQVGIEENTAAACVAQLQEERLIPCTECSAHVPVRDLEAHLLTEHRIYQFRGVRRQRAEMKASILDALCQANPDVPAGRMLEMLAREHGDKAQRRLVTWLCQRLRKVPRPERVAAIGGVAETLTAMGTGLTLLPQLMTPIKWTAGQWLSRCLALEIAARLTVSLADDVLEQMKPLLADRHFPSPSRLRAMVGLLRMTGKEGTKALDLFTAYLAQTSKMRSLEKLRDLEQQIGKSATLDQLYSDTVDLVRMTCPRCGKQLRRKSMVKHLWERHRLVLDGLRAREPWRLIEDWVVDYGVEKDPDLNHLCRDLSFQLDGEQGVFRLQQLMLQHDVDDPDARATVFGRAQKQHASICPRCYHLLPMPALLKSTPPNFEDNEMDGAGYRLQASDKGLVPWLTVETAAETIRNGREPGRVLTRAGAMMLFVIPISLVLFAIMRLTIGAELHPLATLGLAFGFGLVFSGGVYAFWPNPRPVRDRLIDAAWDVLVPRLLDGNLTAKEASFVGGLAQVSPESGNPASRVVILEQCLAHFEQVNDPKYVPIQADLLLLQADDARTFGEDPMPMLMKPLRACLAGKRNFALADHILAELSAANEAGAGLRVRIKMQMADATFAAGLDLGDVPDLAQVYPGFDTLLDVKNADLLISLRYLSSLKGTRPWEKYGKALTVYDLAAEFEQTDSLLSRYPGLLLSTIGQPIFLTTRGLWCEDVCMLEKPRTFEVRKLPPREGYHLILGKDHLWFAKPPDELAKALETWLDYFFTELMPGLEQFSTKRRGEGMKRVAAKNSVACPKCGRHVLPRAGGLGVVGDW